MLEELIIAGIQSENAWDDLLGSLRVVQEHLNQNDIAGAKNNLEYAIYYTKARINVAGQYLKILHDRFNKPKEEPKKLSQSEMSKTLKRVNEERRKFLDENEKEDDK